MSRNGLIRKELQWKPKILPYRSFDGTLALIRDPYRFISNRCRRHQSYLFETRLLLRKAICMTGPEAARLFYDPNRFVRRGAMPMATQKKTLFGVGGVRGLDDGAAATASRCSCR